MKIGIVGLGSMGSGIAQVAADAGFSVIALEVSDGDLKSGLERIKTFMGRGIELGKNTAEDVERVMSGIHPSTSYEALGECDVIIEAVTENLEIKHEVFAGLDRIVGPDTLLATNTSGIAVHEIARVVSRPERLFGLHFFNPAQLMKLVEVVCPIGASKEGSDRLGQFCIDIGKEPVMVKDRPGFLVNRLLIPYLNMAIYAMDAGLASKEDIDLAVELGLGYRSGPLKLLDQIGLDVHLAAATSIYEQSFLPEFRPPAMLREMVNHNHLGTKSGSGFYSYS
jgi:3-hydroxybutyryl-CoA dehydrogenase